MGACSHVPDWRHCGNGTNSLPSADVCRRRFHANRQFTGTVRDQVNRIKPRADDTDPAAAQPEFAWSRFIQAKKETAGSAAEGFCPAGRSAEDDRNEGV